MIAKAKSIEHGRNSMNYALNKKDAEVIDKRFIVGNTGGQIKNEFKLFQRLNQRCKMNDLSFVLSPEPSDGRKLTNKNYKDISIDFLKKMGLEDHQSITVKHNDTDHKHLHIYVNRVNLNGKAYDDSFISKKSQAIADEIAQEKNLIQAKIVSENKAKNTKGIRSEIYEIHKSVLEKKPKNGNEYRALMLEKKVGIIPTINKAGKQQGFRVEFKGENFKASEVHRSMSLGNLAKSLKAIRKDTNPQKNIVKSNSTFKQVQQKRAVPQNIQDRNSIATEDIEKAIEKGVVKSSFNEVDSDELIVHTAPIKKKKKKRKRLL